jgi:hypothetical protein
MIRSAGLLPDALRLRKQTRISRDHGCFEVRDRRPAQHIEGGLRPDAGNVLHEQAKEIAFGAAHEAKEHVRIFADLEMG